MRTHALRAPAAPLLLSASLLLGCYTVVEHNPPPPVPEQPPVAEPAPQAEPQPPQPEPQPPQAAEPEPPPPPPAPMPIAAFCQAFGSNTCSRLGVCGGLGPMPVQQCAGEIAGLCMQRAAAKNVAAVESSDAAACFAAIGEFACPDFLKAHRRSRVVRACSMGSLQPLFKRASP